VDASDGRVYVADSGNNRIDVFDVDGNFLMAFGWGVADGVTNALQTCTATCFEGIPGSGAGQFSSPRSIAVDNDPTSPAYRDVYVAAGTRVQRFDPSGGLVSTLAKQFNNDVDVIVAVGPDGSVYVGDGELLSAELNRYAARIQKFEPSGTFAGASILPDGRYILSLVISPDGDAYVDRERLEKYELSEPNATEIFVNPYPVARIAGRLAIDSFGNPLAVEQEEGTRVLTRYDSSGNVLGRFGYGEIDIEVAGAAFAATGDGVFISGDTQILFIPTPPPGPLACCLEASALGNTKATLKAKINPEGKQTTYHFEYVSDASFKVNGFADAVLTPETAVGSDLSLHPVESAVGCQAPQSPPQAGCLSPDTFYHSRLVATNADAPGGVSVESSFETLPPLQILDTSATGVGTDAAFLHATVNPLGVPATGLFEYVADAAYQADVAALGPDHGFDHAVKVPNLDGGEAAIGLGSGEAPKAVAAAISGLTPGLAYHYRFTAINSFATVRSEERTLTTFPLPSAPGEGCPNQVFRTGASANLPDCRAYEMVSPVEKGNADIAVRLTGNNYPAGLDWGASDGERISYSSEKSFGDAVSAPYASQYLASRVAGEGWSSHGISPPHGSGSISESAEAILDTEYKAFSADLSSGWLMHDTNLTLDDCAAAGFLNLYGRAGSGDFEALSTAKPTNASAKAYVPVLQGVSGDGGHAIFRANGKIAGVKEAVGTVDTQGPIYQLYEHVRGEGCGELRLVSVLPGGKGSTQKSGAGSGSAPGVEGRGSDLTGAISEDGSRIFWTSGGALYVRIEGKETVLISPGPALFRTAAADGSRAIYSVGENLYEFDLESKTQTLIAAATRGVAATSEDASRVYFVSTEALAGAAVAGEPNLYLNRAGGPVSFVAALSDLDFGLGIHFPLAVIGSASELGVRATPAGGSLALISNARLTDYDNRDAGNGRPSVEVYLYDAEADQLSCLSCNPSGARPAGRRMDGPGNQSRMVSAMVPGWENQFHAPHAFSDDGNRLFFESFEGLVPRDGNGVGDVYEWERAASKGECDKKGAELFVATAGGCLSLISSGQSPTDSKLIDASADGSDVFFKTASSLLPQDPGLVDIYDARVGGGFAPQPAPVPACEGEACQGPLSSPNDPTPASSAFNGAGNVKEGGARKPRCRKGKVRSKGRCLAKKHGAAKHRKQANRNRRQGR
jgi:hypothetical protein